MTRTQAHALLNAVRTGECEATESEILDALRATGDAPKPNIVEAPWTAWVVDDSLPRMPL